MPGLWRLEIFGELCIEVYCGDFSLVWSDLESVYPHLTVEE